MWLHVCLFKLGCFTVVCHQVHSYHVPLIWHGGSDANTICSVCLSNRTFYPLFLFAPILEATLRASRVRFSATEVAGTVLCSGIAACSCNSHADFLRAQLQRHRGCDAVAAHCGKSFVTFWCIELWARQELCSFPCRLGLEYIPIASFSLIATVAISPRVVLLYCGIADLLSNLLPLTLRRHGRQSHP
jgi:hypothetical protein